MSHALEVSQIINSLRISDTLTIAEILYFNYPNYYSNIHSTRVQVQKILNSLVDKKDLVKENGFYRVPECKSEYKEHSQILTKALAQVLKLNKTAIIFRELNIPEISLRPDAVILLTNHNKGLCFILEAVNNEPLEYLQMKINAWRSWANANQFLTHLFGYVIPCFDIVTTGDSTLGAFNLNDYLKEVIL